MRVSPGRRAKAIGLAGAALAGLALTVLLTGVARPPGPGPSGPASSGAIHPGPVVYYELLDAEGSNLMERRLDGQSLPRRVAQRTDVDYGRTWSVDPAGHLAIAVVPGAEDQALIAVRIADGATVWQTRTPVAPIDSAIWSADGGRFALATVGDERDARELLVVHAASGAVARGAIPEDAVLQGFDPEGGAILRQRQAEPAAIPSWRFLRFDPATTAVERLIAPPDVGPASNWAEDVHPGAGIAVETTLGDADEGAVIRLWPLAGGPSRAIASFPSVDRIELDPSGAGVAISMAETIRYVALDGRARDLFSGADPIAAFGWSAGGDYLAVATDRLGPNLTVIEGATGRNVVLPQPDLVAQSLFVRIVGGVPLPAVPLPAIEPGPTPTPGPSGADVAGFPGVLSAWVERTPADTEIVHVERLVPTQDGGMRVAATMPELDLGPGGDGGTSVTLLPRPASDDVLVWVANGVATSGWLWHGVSGSGSGGGPADGSTREPVALPGDWPTDASDVAWRPDGQALAGSTGLTISSDEIRPVFVVAEIGATTTSFIPAVGAYDRLEGWWSPTELLVGHGICTEGCEGTFAWSARLRIGDGLMIPMTPADRSVRPIDTVSANADGIILSMTNDDPGKDVRIEFPDLATLDTIDPIGFAGDGRTFLIAVRTADGTDIEAIADPIGRAVDGRLRDPRPTLIGHLAGRGLRVEVSPDQAWAITTDRVESVRLVRLGDGRSWPMDRDRIVVWR